MSNTEGENPRGLQQVWETVQQAGSEIPAKLDQATLPARRNIVGFVFRKMFPAEVEFDEGAEEGIREAYQNGKAIWIFYGHPSQNETLGLPGVWTDIFEDSRKRPMEAMVAAHMMKIPGLQPLADFAGFTLDSLVTVDTQNKIIHHNAKEQLTHGESAVLLPVPKLSDGLRDIWRSVVHTVREGGTLMSGVQGGRRPYMDQEVPSLLELDKDRLITMIEDEVAQNPHRNILQRVFERNPADTQQTLEPTLVFQDTDDSDLHLPVGTFPNEPVKKLASMVRNENVVFVAAGIAVDGVSDYSEVRGFNHRLFKYRFSGPISKDFLFDGNGTPDQKIFAEITIRSDPAYGPRHSIPLYVRSRI